MAGLTLTQHIRPAPILADPLWLPHVVTNLLTNALKYTPVRRERDDRLRPGWTAGPSCTSPTPVRVSGPRTIPRIFDRFWRGQQAQRISGSGIGLAIAAGGLPERMAARSPLPARPGTEHR